MNVRIFTMLSALAVLSPVAAFAQEGEVELDFFIARSTSDNSTVIGTISDENTSIFTLGERFVGVESLPFGAFAFQAAEPGFFNPGAGQPENNFVFPAGTGPTVDGDLVAVTPINVELGDLSGSDLFFWDGSGSVDFEDARDPLFNNSEGVTFNIDPIEDIADVFGFFDDHPTLTLFGGDELNPSVAPEGVYLTSLTASIVSADETIAPSTEESLPLFILFATPGASEETIDTALAFVAANVPEPTSATLLMVAAAGLSLRRRVG